MHACANSPKFTGTGSPTPCRPPHSRHTIPAALHVGRQPRARDRTLSALTRRAGMFQRHATAPGKGSPTGSRQPVDPSSTHGEQQTVFHRSMIQPDSIWRLRANSSSRRDRAPGYQDTNSSQIATPSGRVSRTIFRIRIPANNDTARRKAECAINVCMPLIPGCPCATAGRA